MDSPSGYRQPGKRKGPKGSRGNNPPKPQLFEDTSVQQQTPNMPQYNYPTPPQPNQGYMTGQQPYNPAAYGGGVAGQDAVYPGAQFLNDPMANMAMQYGTSLAGQGKEMVNKNLEKYVSTSKLKYYFAVDTSYVAKKLLLLLLPYKHSDWSVKYNQDEPVAPRDELNARDLYIPVMAFVTYVLASGIVLGVQDRFNPEQLGIQASTALVWVIIELLAVMLSLYIMNLNTELKYLDILAFSGYKFVGMIAILFGGMFFQSTGYYAALLWFSLAIVFFLIRTLKVQIMPHADSAATGFTREGTKRSLYLILTISLLQPVLMWWLTRHIVFSGK